MSKSYKVVKKTINMGKHEGETVYTVNPVSYGLLTTEDVAKQISAESSATPGDVLAVLERYAFFVKQNLKNGYDIELLGFGTLFLRFVTDKAVSDKEKANASLVKALLPGFRPSYTLMRNRSRLYSLIPEKIQLVKYGDEDEKKGSSTEGDGGGSTSGGDKDPEGENVGL